ncbi:MAG: hypothetical protein BWZ02_01914 [Lentisphaerae bacterium ADurb.BinA184]|nr:MAG: hypothetical protein BWZ02_01914 [Lentisphaerae bacterium ADurb.BinA184]
MRRTTVLSIGLMLLAWLAGGVALRLAPRPPRQDGGILTSLLGDSRVALSRTLFASADRYYHGGMTGFDDAAVLADSREAGVATMADGGTRPAANGGHAAAGLLPVADGEPCHHENGEHGADGCHHEGHGLRPRDPWRWLWLQIHPREHRHLTGASLEKEILPWVWAATRADRGNVLAYDVGAYWLATRLKRPERALDLLAEGIHANPGSPQLEYSHGAVLQAQGRLAEAGESLARAEAKWQRLQAAGPSAAEREVARGDSDEMDETFLARILMARGYNAQLRGLYAEARDHYERALPYVKSPEGVRARLAALERLSTPAPPREGEGGMPAVTP